MAESSERSYEKITTDDLARLAKLALDDLADFSRAVRKPALCTVIGCSRSASAKAQPSTTRPAGMA
jgi:hypothetical protein